MRAAKALLKSRKGVTLSEVLVTVAILAIILPSVMSALFSELEVFSKTKTAADLSVLSTNLENSIVNQLAFGYNTEVDAGGSYVEFEKYGAETVKLDTRPTGADNISILYVNGSPLYDVSYYNGISTTASFTQDVTSKLITVVLSFSGRVDKETTFTVKPLS